ncbi:MAG TPA: radical SAM protein [Gaiellaceae bacterium]|nr:radical SAM protein [Gaiellaceae bacterium]
MNALHPELPSEVQIEVTGSCNLACKMCLVRYRPKLGKAEGAMPFATFKSILDRLPTLERVTLQGLGEPLLAPDLFRMIEYAAARGIRMGFNTNGTLLTRDKAERLVRAGLDWLHISLDGATAPTYEGIRHGSDFERVRANVLELVRTMRQLDKEKPTLSLVFVAMRRNIGELPELVRLTAAWGVGQLFVQNLSHSFGDTDPAGTYRDIREFAASEALWAEEDKAEAEKSFAAARALAARLGVELRLPRIEQPPKRPRPAGSPGCHWPFGSAYVTHDAKVQPCCMVMGSDRAVLGDLARDDITAVWQGEAYEEFRRRLLSDDNPPDVCRDCSLYRGVF